MELGRRQDNEFTMTLPYERARSILYAQSVLRSLLFDGTEEDSLSNETKERIRSALRHYPTEYDVRELAKKCPEILFMADEVD